ncbi:MAG: VOC family protein [Candidatus Eisenbacteria bacterium]|nr:VOC family protein [Candidatus Eisenbacteria bacterium]
MTAELDHVVVVVSALAEAMSRFRGAGFTVVPGGRHEGLPTENALVVFADGSYLELLATLDPDSRRSLRELRGPAGGERWERHLHGSSALARRFLPSLAGPDGVSDWALRVERLDRLAAESRRRGDVMTGPVALGRERPDGARLDMRLLFPAERWMPFLIEDRSPRALRIPDDAASRTHANGARGIGRVSALAGDVAGAALACVDRMDARVASREDGAAEVAFGAVRLELLPGGPPGACGAALAGVRALPPELTALGLTPGG